MKRSCSGRGVNGVRVSEVSAAERDFRPALTAAIAFVEVARSVLNHSRAVEPLGCTCSTPEFLRTR